MNRQAAMDQSTRPDKGFQPILLTLSGRACFLPRMSEQKTPIRSVCVYCGSQPGRDPAFMEAGRNFGRALAENNLRLVYGGGTKGIMGAVAAGVLSAGGHVTGIIPEFLVDMEATRHSLGQLNELIITKDMHERKHKMAMQSDAFIALPGGIGTMEEIFEVWTWRQLGYHRKALGLLNVDGYYDELLRFIERSRDSGFLWPDVHELLLVDTDAERLRDTLGDQLVTAVSGQGQRLDLVVAEQQRVDTRGRIYGRKVITT